MILHNFSHLSIEGESRGATADRRREGYLLFLFNKRVSPNLYESSKLQGLYRPQGSLSI